MEHLYDIVKSGAMVKRAQNKKRFTPVNFKLRWFELTKKHFCYFNEENVEVSFLEFHCGLWIICCEFEIQMSNEIPPNEPVTASEATLGKSSPKQCAAPKRVKRRNPWIKLKFAFRVVFCVQFEFSERFVENFLSFVNKKQWFPERLLWKISKKEPKQDFQNWLKQHKLIRKPVIIC